MSRAVALFAVGLVLFVARPARADDDLAREARLLVDGALPARRAAIARLEAWPEQPDGARVERLLARALGDEAGLVRGAAAAALARRGARHHIDVVREALGQEVDPLALAPLLHALGLLGLTGDGPRVNPYVLHPDPAVRRAAVLALGDLGAPAAADVARRMIVDPRGEDPGEGVRAAAALVLGRRGSAEDAAWLIQRVGDRTVDPAPGWLLRSAYAQAIGRLGGEGATAALVSLLGDPDARVAVTAATGLATLGARQVLLGALGHAEPAVRAAAIGGVLQGRVRDGYPVLASLARRDPSRDVRWAATSALWKLEMREADAYVIEGLGASDPGVVLAAHHLLVERLGQDHQLDVEGWKAALARWWQRR
ncbi:MAG: HEAT repeat domain-containing protein [Planctomycetota bacterium]